MAVALADGPGGHLHGLPTPVVGPAYGTPAYHEPDYNTPPVYEFGYGVQGDAYHGGANFGHNEARNGYSTKGEYRVQLPDGRTQIVTYSVGDAHTGYVADVRYEGTAIPYVPAAPAYGSAPVAPAYGPGPIHG